MVLVTCEYAKRISNANLDLFAQATFDIHS